MAKETEIKGGKEVSKKLDKATIKIINAQFKGAKKGVILVQNEAKLILRKKGRIDSARTMNLTRGFVKKEKNRIRGFIASSNGAASYINEFGSGIFAESKGRVTPWFVSAKALKNSKKWRERFPSGFKTRGIKGIKFLRGAAKNKKDVYIKKINGEVIKAKVVD